MASTLSFSTHPSRWTSVAFFWALMTSSAASEALGLVLRDVGAVDDVGDELWAEGKVRLLQSM